ncbi:MAG: hypothetical protein GW855_06395 [Erythrobacter sp.]|nr:hypothetical protein [Erythrobacter sp.]NCQ64492.1 hypothetical protein [Alphaproteobacteria bacterium]
MADLASNATAAAGTHSEGVIEVDGSHGSYEEPTLLWLESYQWVSVAMLILVLIAIFAGKVHKTIGGGLDERIAAIREELDEAKRLRSEAETLRDEYSAKIANAESDAAAMLENAKAEAESILDRAEADSKALVERRKRMAQDKISAAEREAVAEVRARAATASAEASRKLIREKLDADADRKLADDLIAGI